MCDITKKKFLRKNVPYFLLIFVLFFPQKIFSNSPQKELSTAHTKFLPIHTIYDDDWRTLEYFFIIAPENDINSIKSKFFRSISEIIGMTPGFFWIKRHNLSNSLKNIFEQIKNQQFSSASEMITQKLIMKLVVLFVFSGINSEITKQFVDKIIRSKIYATHFQNFIISWPNIKDQIPQSFHKLFDYVYGQNQPNAQIQNINSEMPQKVSPSTNILNRLIRGKTISKKYLKKMSALITPKVQHAIYERFPIKYQEQLSPNTKVGPFLKKSLVKTLFSIIAYIAFENKEDILTYLKNIAKITFEEESPDTIEEKPKTPEIETDYKPEPIESPKKQGTTFHAGPDIFTHSDDFDPQEQKTITDEEMDQILQNFENRE